MKFNIFTKSFLLIFPFVLFVNADMLTAKDQSKIQPGKYILDRGMGVLLIKSDGKAGLTFEISTVAGNCHTCDLSGVISGTIGYMDSWAEDGNKSKCEISFTVDHSNILVKSLKLDECRAFCGARAGFDGIYRIPPKNCTDEGRTKKHNKFLSLYRSHHYAQAAKILQNQLQQCSDFMNWIEKDEIRNDLALAQYHNGEFHQCLSTLNETLVANVKNEEELKEGKDGFYLPPCDYDNYIHVAKSTWFNKALCNKAIAYGK
jgi:hypothetical protein